MHTNNIGEESIHSKTPANKVLKILTLLEKTEKLLLPPSSAQHRVVILGKGFIMKRDFDIWEITYGDARFKVSATSKQQIQHDKDSDWVVMLCLDLFDGKTHCIEPTELLELER